MKNTFKNTQFWRILERDQAVTPAQIDRAIEKFEAAVLNFCRRESDLAQRMRTLRLTRSGLVTSASRRSHLGAGKKCPGLCA